MARKRKTARICVVQGRYDGHHGWEDVTAGTTRKECLQHLREYRENERGVPFRIVWRRERLG